MSNHVRGRLHLGEGKDRCTHALRTEMGVTLSALPNSVLIVDESLLFTHETGILPVFLGVSLDQLGLMTFRTLD